MGSELRRGAVILMAVFASAGCTSSGGRCDPPAPASPSAPRQELRTYGNMSKSGTDGATLWSDGTFGVEIWLLDCRVSAKGTWTPCSEGTVIVRYTVTVAERYCADKLGRTFVAMVRAAEEELDVVQEWEVFSDGRASIAARPGVSSVLGHMPRYR